MFVLQPAARGSYKVYTAFLASLDKLSGSANRVRTFSAVNIGPLIYFVKRAEVRGSSSVVGH